MDDVFLQSKSPESNDRLKNVCPLNINISTEDKKLGSILYLDVEFSRAGSKFVTSVFRNSIFISSMTICESFIPSY